MTNYTQKAVFGAGASLVMGFLASLIMYLTRIIMARNLGPKDYGLFYSVFTIIIFFLFFRDLGLGTSLVKYISEFRAKKKYDNIKTSIVFVFLFQLISSLTMGVILFLMADFLAKSYFKELKASLILKIIL
jgi:O-antigen/teichoic acid export membrane protein